MKQETNKKIQLADKKQQQTTATEHALRCMVPTRRTLAELHESLHIKHTVSLYWFFLPLCCSAASYFFSPIKCPPLLHSAPLPEQLSHHRSPSREEAASSRFPKSRFPSSVSNPSLSSRVYTIECSSSIKVGKSLYYKVQSTVNISKVPNFRHWWANQQSTLHLGA